MKEILDELRRLYPNAGPELNFSNPYETLVATMLSAQCTDKQVNKVTPEVFRRYPNATAMAACTRDELYPLVKSCGFKSKAGNIIEACRIITQKYGGEVQFIMVDAVGSMNGETRQAGSDYVAEQGFTFPVYFDDEQSAVMAFGLRAFPTTFFLHADGTIAAYGEGMLDAETLEKGIGMILPDAVQGAA